MYWVYFSRENCTKDTQCWQLWVLLWSIVQENIKICITHFRPGGGGHWPRKGVWGCAALKTPISRLSCRSQGSHFKQNNQFTSPPFEKILKFLASTASILAHKPPNLEIFSSQAPRFGNFQLTSPQIWKFSAHKPPFSETNVSSQAPHFGNPGRTSLPEKKLSAPPGLQT